MDSLFGGSKSSLHETIKGQQQRLAKYEKKLGDLVKAYKSLQDEKTALQETVNAFSKQSSYESFDQDGVGKEEPLKQQVAALTKTLSSLNETKNTLELRFQHDKKELLEHVDNLQNLLSEEQKALQQERSSHELLRKEMKSKLRNEQHEREQEQTHHVAMLRELQHMLANERNSNQKLEMEVDELRSSKNSESQQRLFEDKIRLLRDERDYLACEVEKQREKSNEPHKQYISLKKEVEELRGVKAELEAVRSEQDTIAIQHLQTTADQTRIRELENRLTDLSELVAEYDLTRKRDQEEISRLQGRVTTLEREAAVSQTRAMSVSVNTNVIIDTPLSPTSPTHDVTSPSHDVTSPPHDVSSSSSGVMMSDQVSREVIPLKLVSKNREVEISKLKDTVQYYKQEIVKLQEEKRSQQMQLVAITEQHKQGLIEMEAQHSLEIKELEKGYSSRLNELIDSSNKARQRSQELLAERDVEIAEFKAKINPKRRSNVNTAVHNEEEMVSELLNTSDNIPRTMVFYKTQQQYLTEELSKLKEHRDHLDQVLREKERNEHVYVTEVTALKQEVSRLIRNTSRESANMEYLKNIVLRYLRATSGSEKRQILLAIFTVLHFSDDEKSSVKHKLMPGWFS